VEDNCAWIKVDWLAVCIELVVACCGGWRCRDLYFSYGVGVKFAQSSSQWEERVIPEEMSQTLLKNKKQGNLDLVPLLI
jgi:hypothetical protein